MTDSLYAGGGIGLGPRPAAAEREPYPAPLVTSRDGVAGPDKRAVADLVRLAEGFGWTVRVTYARGCFPHAATGRPTAEKDSLAVRMVRYPESAVAVYVGGSVWKWDTLVCWSSLRFQRYTLLADFQQALL